MAYLTNYSDNRVLTGTSENDSLYNYADLDSFSEGRGWHVTMDGGDGDDYISTNADAAGQHVVMIGGAGDDTLRAWGYYASNSLTINGGPGDDYIYTHTHMANEDLQIRYALGDGNDTFDLNPYSRSWYYLNLDADAKYSTMASGNDKLVWIGTGSILFQNLGDSSLIIQNGTYVSSSSNSIAGSNINGSSSDDVIFNSGARTTIKAGAGDDQIINSAQTSSINGGTGSDLIVNSGSNSTLLGGGDNDSIENTATYSVLDGGDGSDSLTNRAEYVTMLGGAGSDSIENSGNRVTLEGGAGSDSLINAGNYVSMSGGENNDTLVNNYGEHVTLNGGAGNDVLVGSTEDGDVFIYSSGDGNDLIRNFDGEDTIRLLDNPNYSTLTSGSNVLVSLANGSITLNNYSSAPKVVGGTFIAPIETIANNTAYRTINGTSNAEVIINIANYVTINALEGNDTIGTSGYYNSVGAGAGNDSVYVYVGSNDASIRGGTGADTIRDGGARSKIFGESGNDLIYLFTQATNTTVDAGADRDEIYSAATNASLNAGAGNDYIHLYTQSTGNTVRGGAGNDTLQNYSDGFVYEFGAGDGNDVINGFTSNSTIKVLDGATISTVKSGSDMIVSIGSGSITLKNTSAANIVGGFHPISNSSGNKLIVGTSLNDSITNSGSNVTIQSGAGNDTLVGSSNGELYLLSSADGNNLITNFGVNDSLKMMTGQSFYYKKSGADMIVTLKGASYSGVETLGGASSYKFMIKDRVLYAVNTINNTSSNRKVVGTSGADSIANSAANVTIQANGGNDTITGSNYGEMFLFSSADGSNLITNFGENDSISVTAGAIETIKTIGNDAIVSLKGTKYSGVITLKGAGAYNFQRQGNLISGSSVIDNASNNVLIVGTSGSDTIRNSGANVTIQANGGNDVLTGSSNGELYLFSSADGNNLITNFGVNDSLKMTTGQSFYYKKSGADMLVTLKGSSYSGVETLGGASSYKFMIKDRVLYAVNTINNTSSNRKIVGTSGADSIANSAANVTIQANGGNDTIKGSSYGEMFLFSSADGSNVIQNFGENDSISVTAGSIETIKTIGNDAIVSLKGTKYSGVITLKGAGELDLVSSGKLITVEPAKINYIDNSDDGVKVSGTDNADWIFNSGEHVTIQANGGRDTIEGSEDYGDVFLFSSADGSNVITNFGANDTLKITAGSIQTVRSIGDDAVVSLKGTSYSGAVTLLGAGSLELNWNASMLIADPINYITNSRDGVRVNGTSGRDYITNGGDRVTLEGKAGNDTLEGSSHGDLFLFASDGGNDVIKNFGANDTIRITAGSIQTKTKVGNDYVIDVKGTKYAGTLTLLDAASLNLIQSSSYLTVDGVNNIVNRSNNRKVLGTDGRDFITNSGSGVSIQSGKGNDTIEGSDHGDVFLFSSADGNNVITNFDLNDTLRCTAGSITATAVSGDDFIVTLKGTSYTGTVRLLDAADYSFVKNGNTLVVNPINVINRSSDRDKIVGTDRADSITSSGQYVTIQANGGADTITGSDEYGDFFLFSSADGNDLITNFGANDSIRITAGSLQSINKHGNDCVIDVKGAKYAGTLTLKDAASLDLIQNGSYLYVDAVKSIVNRSNNVKVVGSDGRDFITNSGSGVSIQSGKGNDTIEGSDHGEMFLFSSADGDNVITNFGTNDTLKVTSGNLVSVRASGEDAIVSLKGTKYSGSVTLQGAGEYDFNRNGNTLTVKASDVEAISNALDNVKFSGTSAADYMINGGSNVTLDGKGGDDTIEGSNEGTELFLFSAADGHDVVYNFGANDTLKISSGSIANYFASGSDYVIEVAKAPNYSGSVTLKNVGSIGVSGNLVRATSFNSQLPSLEEYWFARSDQVVDEINSILSIENNQLDLEFDPIDRLKPSEIELVSSARSERIKK